MSWTRLLAEGRIQKIEPSEESVQDLLRLADRDLTDAKVLGLSDDRRFATAYGAALNLARAVILFHGYRVKAVTGHHMAAFEAVQFAMGKGVVELAEFFDYCRRKRNKVDYDFVDVVSESEVMELLMKVEEFRRLVHSHIKAKI